MKLGKPLAALPGAQQMRVLQQPSRHVVSSVLYATSLPSNWDDEDIREYISRVSPLQRVKWMDQHTSAETRSALLFFNSPSDSIAAHISLNGDCPERYPVRLEFATFRSGGKNASLYRSVPSEAPKATPKWKLARAREEAAVQAQVERAQQRQRNTAADKEER